MKTQNYHIKLIISCFCLFLAACSNYTETKESKSSVLKFDSFFHDFGKIKNGDTVYHTFKFTNIGAVPLIIYDISTSCGCTLADWTKTPVLPGHNGVVKVQFTKRQDPGVHIKHIIVKANTKDPYSILKISATINK